jgi:hypothetical protein
MASATRILKGLPRNIEVCPSEILKSCFHLIPSLYLLFKRAEIEVYTSHHQSDEFWYTNLNPSPFKELVVHVDGFEAGVISPFPLIFTGGITPYLWRPIVSIGAMVN